jgi:hypothetical protein
LTQVNAAAPRQCFDRRHASAPEEMLMTAPRKRRRTAKAPRSAAPPAETAAPGFDEPAMPPPQPNPSIEEPTTPAMREGEPEGACGLPDARKIRSSDLN